MTHHCQPVLAAWQQLMVRFSAGADRSSRRIFHGRGGAWPGLEWLNLDFHDPMLFFSLYQPPPPGFDDWLMAHWWEDCRAAGVSAMVLQERYRSRSPSRVLAGVVPDPLYARRGPLRFLLNPVNQNVGYFLDMETGRQWLEQSVQGQRVLNLFSYTCAFSVVAMAAGAGAVVNVDMSRSALNTGRENHRINELDTRDVRFLALNILKSWGRLKRLGPFDRIIADPPSYQPGSFVVTRDYARLLRRLPELAAPGAEVLVCLNSPNLDHGFLQTQLTGCAGAYTPVASLLPGPDFPDIDPGRGLKLRVWRVNARPD